VKVHEAGNDNFVSGLLENVELCWFLFVMTDIIISMLHTAGFSLESHLKVAEEDQYS
jgi:hypothetical protein